MNDTSATTQGPDGRKPCNAGSFLSNAGRNIRKITLLYCFLAVHNAYGQEHASRQDSLDVYNNAKAVQDFYETSGHYRKTNETRINTDDAGKIHAGNDKKYAEVLGTIQNERLTPQGKRKIKPEEYRINIDKNKYRQRELSDYVLNTDAPMQLFDRRIAPQILVDYTSSGNINSPVNDDDVDFRMYDPVAVKPYNMLTPAEKALRNMRYPRVITPGSNPVSKEKAVTAAKPPQKPAKPIKTVTSVQAANKSDFIICGDVPDSVRFKRFKTRQEAEEFIKALPANGQ